MLHVLLIKYQINIGLYVNQIILLDFRYVLCKICNKDR